MVRFLRGLLKVVLVLGLLLATAWGAMALWFRLPGPEILRMAVAAAFVFVGLFTLRAQFTQLRVQAAGVYTMILLVLISWWSTILPAPDGDWIASAAHQTTGQIDGDILTLSHVRNFDWRSDTDFTEIWQERQYDLSQVRTIDLVMAYWAGPEMAHLMLSFGFADDTYLVWSIEVRREAGSEFSPVADFFKSHNLVILAAEERDIIALRSNVWDNDVQMFRLKAAPETARRLLEEYVRDANRLAAKPAFFNSLTTNCTTVLLKMVRAVGDRLPLDWRLIVNGYLPDYAYDQGAVDTRVSLDQLREQGRITARAQAHGTGPGYSQAIRAGLPMP